MIESKYIEFDKILDPCLTKLTLYLWIWIFSKLKYSLFRSHLYFRLELTRQYSTYVNYWSVLATPELVSWSSHPRSGRCNLFILVLYRWGSGIKVHHFQTCGRLSLNLCQLPFAHVAKADNSAVAMVASKYINYLKRWHF